MGAIKVLDLLCQSTDRRDKLARIRTQLSAAHEKEHLDRAIAAFIKVGRKYGILGKTKNEIIQQYGL